MVHGLGINIINSKSEDCMDQLLVDSTGNRRFVPIRIPNTHDIPWRRLQDKRVGLWAAAVKLYREGQQWEYTSGQLAELSAHQDDFLERDSWWDTVVSYVSDQSMVTTGGILRYAISLDLDKINNGHQRRVGRVMRALGWENTSRKINGKSTRVWGRPRDSEQLPPKVSDF